MDNVNLIFKPDFLRDFTSIDCFVFDNYRRYGLLSWGNVYKGRTVYNLTPEQIREKGFFFFIPAIPDIPELIIEYSNLFQFLMGKDFYKKYFHERSENNLLNCNKDTFIFVSNHYKENNVFCNLIDNFIAYYQHQLMM